MIQDLQDGETVDGDSEGAEEKVDDRHVPDRFPSVPLLWGRPLVVDDNVDSILRVSGRPPLLDKGPANKVLHPAGPWRRTMYQVLGSGAALCRPTAFSDNYCSRESPSPKRPNSRVNLIQH